MNSHLSLLSAEHGIDGARLGIKGKTYNFQDNDDLVLSSLPQHVRDRAPFIVTEKAAITDQVMQLMTALRRRFIPISTGVEVHTLIRWEFNQVSQVSIIPMH